ncbi:hypothetical protein DSL72_006331 [Monilinia vaccinii-corymbosi]|uniref:Uncharacterized protein n=1 Tax=Monilinia vaccinii-corymbosi TaxID=61207 RepID=A0A8A3PLY2_9HELO|nr:hypothetical protein DSL72_006331 [Monilinia vaccinii-corymbosi]
MDTSVHDGAEKSAPAIRSFQRVVGPLRPHLKRDLAWWASVETSEALAGFTWEGQQDRECLSLGFGRKGTEFSGSKPVKEKASPKRQLYTMMANISKEKFLAQHIFSTFMWTIVSSFPIAQKVVESTTEVILPSDDKLKLNTPNPNWNSLRLTNKSIKEITKAIEISGLGSLEDAYLLIIPPLSYSYKLPNENMINEVRNKAKDNEVGYRDTACKFSQKTIKVL